MFAFLSVALCTSFVGCSDDDPDYSNVTPPTVSVSHSIGGRVTGMDGNGLSATVSMNGESTQTGADGTFTFDDVDAGSYTPTASRSGTVQGNNRHRCRKRKRSQCRMERVIAQ